MITFDESGSGIITTVAGPVHPAGPGSFDRAQLYSSRSFTAFPDTLVSVGEFGRAMRLDLSTSKLNVVLGNERSSGAPTLAAFASLLDDLRGVAFDPIARTLVITEANSGSLRVVGLDPDDDGLIDHASRWTSATVDTELSEPAGIVYDDGDDTFVVADERDHCVRRIDRDGITHQTITGICGAPGSFPGFMDRPSHVAVSPTSGAVYVSDTGNHRVLRVADGMTAIVIGDGSVSSAGEGAPAKLFPLNAPRQLALDSYGKFFVTSTTTVREVANVDGDADADGDDRVFTIYGGGDRAAFPESSTLCMTSLVVVEQSADEEHVYAADACQGFVVDLVR